MAIFVSKGVKFLAFLYRGVKFWSFFVYGGQILAIFCIGGVKFWSFFVYGGGANNKFATPPRLIHPHPAFWTKFEKRLFAIYNVKEN